MSSKRPFGFLELMKQRQKRPCTAPASSAHADYADPGEHSAAGGVPARRRELGCRLLFWRCPSHFAESPWKREGRHCSSSSSAKAPGDSLRSETCPPRPGSSDPSRDALVTAARGREAEVSLVWTCRAAPRVSFRHLQEVIRGEQIQFFLFFFSNTSLGNHDCFRMWMWSRRGCLETDA